jgi:hypothetical protein
MNIHCPSTLWRRISLKGVLLLLLVLVVIDVFFGADQVGVEGRALPRLLRLAVCVLMFVWVISEEHEYTIGLSFGFSLVLLALVMGMSVAVSSENMRVDVVDLSKTYYWILGFFFIVGMTRHGVLTPRVLTYFTTALVFLLSAKILVLDTLSGSSDAATTDYRNDGWTLVLCLPLVLLVDRSHKRWMYFCLILMVVAVFLALKRGAILALIAAMACWLISSTENTVRAKLVSVLKVMAVVALAGIVIISRQDAYAERLDDISSGYTEDLGSGRGLLYQTVWERIERADGVRLVLGYGYASVPNAMAKEIGVRVYAHSDVLEVFHDHGLIGISLLVMMFASLSKLWFSLRKIDPITSTALLCAIVILGIQGMISMVIYEPNTIHMAVALGYIRGKVAYDAQTFESEDMFEYAPVGNDALQT